MAIVIKNSVDYYIARNDDGKIMKVQDVDEAEDFSSVRRAIDFINGYSAKTKGYFVYDTSIRKLCWRKKPKRKQYSKEVRKMLYNKADGRCQLCGRKILFESMTLDHVIPLKMGGEDNVNNLQIACEICNSSKASYLPDDFQDRIFDVFCYDMEKKHGDNVKWKLAHNLLLSLR